MSHVPNQRARNEHRAFMEAGFEAQQEWQTPKADQQFTVDRVVQREGRFEAAAGNVA